MMKKILILILVVNVVLGAEKAKKKKVDTRHFGGQTHGGIGTGIGGLGTGGTYGNQGASIIAHRPPAIPSSGCRYWCKDHTGAVQCCEKDTQQVSAVFDKGGFCPAVRCSCPATRFGPPKTCSNDGSCPGLEKCCYDRCLEGTVCKAPQYTAPIKLHCPPNIIGVGGQNQAGYNQGIPGVGGIGNFNQGIPGVGGFNQGIPGVGGFNQGIPGVGGFNQGIPGVGGFNQGIPGVGGFNQGIPGVGGFNQGIPGVGGFNQGRPGVGGYNTGGSFGQSQHRPGHQQNQGFANVGGYVRKTG